jgi:sugar phosphate isomerase/epimerase
MRLKSLPDVHLTYCTNIHPGESWAEVRANLERFVVPVRREIGVEGEFGLGLRLSALAARELSEPSRLEELRSFLTANGLYVYTINGFPYGPFHGQPVKEEVYLPDWASDERLLYTNLLADLLAELLPDMPGLEGTISTVPGAFAERVRSEADARTLARQMARHVAHLHRLGRSTGKRIALALEPEPCCFLETVDQTIAFFRDHLFGDAGVETLVNELALPAADCERLLHDHLSVCFDACHMAVEFEEPAEAMRAFDDAGIRIGKFQISAGLRVELTGRAEHDEPRLRELGGFADPVYLHQVVERSSRGIRRYLDLPEALRAAASDPLPREWRIHFHVPLFREQLGAFQSTQPYLVELIDLLKSEPRDAHWEVETYTWDVLPEEHRAGGVVAAVVRELGWVVEQVDRR